MSSDDESDLLRHVRNSSHNDENSMMDFIPLNDDQESEMYDSEPEVREDDYPQEPPQPQRTAETNVLCHKIRRLKVIFSHKPGMKDMNIMDIDYKSHNEVVQMWEEMKGVCLGNGTDGGIAKICYVAASRTSENFISYYEPDILGATNNALANETINDCLKIIDVDMNLAITTRDPYMMLMLATGNNALSTISENKRSRLAEIKAPETPANSQEVQLNSNYDDLFKDPEK